jgi:trehalose utilization protein
MAPDPVRVLIWNEFRTDRMVEQVRRVYPDGIHYVLDALLRDNGFHTRTATLDEPEHGLTRAALVETDVLIWWGHRAHDEVEDRIVERVQERVHAGMGLVVLHSGVDSKLFKKLMGTGCTINWRDDGERERLWVVTPDHPIAAGIDRYFELEKEEMYGEVFGIPAPEEIVFISWFQGGEVFRSGCTFRRGLGRIFYFRPGHETFPTYYDANVRRVIVNGCRWAAPNIDVNEPLQNMRQPSIESIV